MITSKKAELTAKTAKFTFCAETPEERGSAIALALLTGSYNALRAASPKNSPIEISKLEEFQERFANLLWEVRREMTVDIAETPASL